MDALLVLLPIHTLEQDIAQDVQTTSLEPRDGPTGSPRDKNRNQPVEKPHRRKG